MLSTEVEEHSARVCDDEELGKWAVAKILFICPPKANLVLENSYGSMNSKQINFNILPNYKNG